MPPEPAGPFKFLDPYTRADRDIFFGRERETEALYAQLLARGLLLIYGVSGSGKTSLVQCGLANRFEPADCLAITVRRGADLPAALDAELVRHAVTPARPGATIAQRVRSLYLDHFKPIHLIFDQLEELFIFGDRDERRAFAGTLHALAGLPREVRLIFVVCEEYLGAMTEFEPVLPDLFRARIRIEPMDRAQARDAIDGPCARRGVALEAGLTDAVLERLAPGEATIELTWLQVVMDRLYREAQTQIQTQAQTRDPARPTLTRAGLDALGPLDNVLGRFLEGQLQALAQPLAGEAVLKALVSGDGTRRPLSQEAIAQSATVRAQGLTGEALALLIQRLIAARILTDRDDHGLYELRHDSLARKVWERMSAREKELQEVRQMIDGRYRDHQRRGLLLDAETLNWIAPFADGLYLPTEQAAFVQASRAAVARKRRRWLTLAFGTLLLVLVVVAGLGGLAWLKSIEAREQTVEAQRQRDRAEQQAGEAERQRAEAQQQTARAEQQAAEAQRQEREARHNLGFVFLEKAERSVTDKRFNEARLYALHALANFDPARQGPERATGIVIKNPVYPLALFGPGSDPEIALMSVSFSPDGRLLASGFDGHTIRLWDAATGQQQALLTVPDGFFGSVAFSADGRTLASGSDDSTVRLWNVATGQQQAVWRVQGIGLNITFSPNGQLLAASPIGAITADNNTIRLWDMATGRQQAVLKGYEGVVGSVAFSPDGQTLAAGFSDATIRLWDVATGQQTAVLKNHGNWVTTLTFSSNGGVLASGSADKTIRLWYPVFGQQQSELRDHVWNPVFGQRQPVLRGHEDTVESLAFSAGVPLLASGSRDGTVRVWDVKMGHEVVVLRGNEYTGDLIAFSSDGRTLASASWGNTIRLWDMAMTQEPVLLSGHREPVNSVTFSPDGQRLASGSGSDGFSKENSIRLWDLATGEQTAVLMGHDDGVESVAFAWDGRTLASGSRDRTIRLWDATTGKHLAVLMGHDDGVESVAFAPDGQTLASGSRDSTIRLWDVTTGKYLAVLTGHEAGVDRVAFAPDEQTLASGSWDDTIRLWDVATFQQQAMLREIRIDESSVGLSSDGQRAAPVSWESNIPLWYLATGQQKTLGIHEGDVTNFAVSRDGRLMAVAFVGGTIRLWDVPTGQPTAVLTGHTAAVNSLSFSPDGRTLAAGSHDGTIRLWNLSFLYDPRPIGEQIKAAERQFGLHLVDLQLQPLPPEPNPDGTPPPAVWSAAHPFHWLPAAERGDPVAMRQLGIIHERGNEWSQAETWYRQAADAGDAEAKTRLADLLRRHPATP